MAYTNKLEEQHIASADDIAQGKADVVAGLVASLFMSHLGKRMCTLFWQTCVLSSAHE